MCQTSTISCSCYDCKMRKIFFYFFQYCIIVTSVIIIQNIYLLFLRPPKIGDSKGLAPPMNTVELDALKKKIKDLEAKLSATRSAWNTTVITGTNHVAIGCAVTSKGLPGLTIDNLSVRHPFFRDLLPSFCRTASPNYNYHFYVAFDEDDFLFAKTHVVFETLFVQLTEACGAQVGLSLRLVSCPYSGRPAWSQADAMWQAYLDNIPYYYRINDDTIMDSSGWTEAYIAALKNFRPSNVGVVGPSHLGGNLAILTYDFVHRTHIDIFGVYYPRTFTDWFADQWITEVYRPERSLKLQEVRVVHTMEAGTRYTVNRQVEPRVEAEISLSKSILSRWLHNHKDSNATTTKGSKNVIAFSLYGNNRKYTLGAIRNAQLTSVYFPGWVARFYVIKEARSNVSPVPEQVIRKLQQLGAQIQAVTAPEIPPMMWRFLVADDVTVDRFLVRDTDSRLSDRDAAVVNDWITSQKAFHCIRDHPSHGKFAVSGGMFGGWNGALREIFNNQPWVEMFRGYGSEYGADMAFLSERVWPAVTEHALCHDSVTCTKWPSSQKFPVARVGWEHVGQVFDGDGIPRQGDIDLLTSMTSVAECSPQAEEPVTSPPRSVSMTMLSSGVARDALFDLSSTLGKQRVTLVHYNTSVCQSSGLCKPRDVDVANVSATLCVYPGSACVTSQRCPVILLAYMWSVSDARSGYDLTLVPAVANESRNTVTSLTRFDQEYVHHYTGIQTMYMPPLCSYIKTGYAPVTSDVLLLPTKVTFELVFSRSLQHELKDSAVKVTPMRDLYTEYSVAAVASHPAVVYIPSHVTSLRLYELLRLGVPIYTPTADLLTHWQATYDVIIWPGSRPRLRPVGDEPELGSDVTALRYWIRRLDHYEWPGVIQFNSISDLQYKLKHTDLPLKHKEMMEFNTHDLTRVKGRWLQILDRIQSDVR